MQYCLELPKPCYHPGWRLMRTEYRMYFHTLYDEKKLDLFENYSYYIGIFKKHNSVKMICIKNSYLEVIIVYKGLSLFLWNIWKYITVWKSIVLNRNTWNHIIFFLQIIIIISLKSISDSSSSPGLFDSFLLLRHHPNMVGSKHKM